MVAITALISKAHLVRQVAADLGLSYEEKLVPNRDDLIRIDFGSLDDENSLLVAMAVPRDAYYFQGIFVGSNDPR